MKRPQNKPSDKRKKTSLARAISKLGHCSRSQAAEEIKAGRVRVNGVVRRNPETPVLFGNDRITIEGKVVAAAARVYLMMNKTRGLVTTASDEKNRPTVYSLLPPGTPWVSPVGRLDQASEGLLLFTNDSGWAAAIAAPESHLDKTYHVQVSTIADERLLDLLRNGITTPQGDFLQVKSVEVLRTGGSNSWIEVILDEGKNRQIRRMLEQRGVEVLRLVRVAIGPLVLGDLAKSACRALSKSEKLNVDRALRGISSSSRKNDETGKKLRGD
ncbi:MAG TPA: pseudouridine synthase [Candidatus Dormibacteraeota bacterium]|nr:pseudouridine synthase [Candidatus Dormibacteraeota bacterium]